MNEKETKKTDALRAIPVGGTQEFPATDFNDIQVWRVTASKMGRVENCTYSCEEIDGGRAVRIRKDIKND